MLKLTKMIFSFVLNMIPFTSFFKNDNMGNDIIVTVTEDNRPAKKISSLISTIAFVTISYIPIYASFTYLPSFLNYSSYEKGGYEKNISPVNSSVSNIIFGAPFSLDWNMSIKNASEVSFLSKKPLVCNGLENGVNGSVECYFKNVSYDDISDSRFFNDQESSRLKEIVVGSDLILGFQNNHLNSIRYIKKFDDNESSKNEFKSQSTKMMIELMDRYEIRLSPNAFTSKNSHHFVTIDINEKDLIISINYLLYDNYME